MANLFPVGYETEVIEEGNLVEDKSTGYLNGLSFDDESGDFRRDGMNKILDSDGIESWKSWCINCLHTERYKHLAYSTDFGIDRDAVFSAETPEAAESILAREITEAIMADPYGRTKYIEDLDIEWEDADTILAQLTIHGIDDVTIDITAYITKGEI